MPETKRKMELTEEEFDVITRLLESEEAEEFALKQGRTFSETFFELKAEYHEKVS